MRNAKDSPNYLSNIEAALKASDEISRNVEAERAQTAAEGGGRATARRARRSAAKLAQHEAKQDDLEDDKNGDEDEDALVETKAIEVPSLEDIEKRRKRNAKKRAKQKAKKAAAVALVEEDP
jgi:hypothetical protein